MQALMFPNIYFCQVNFMTILLFSYMTALGDSYEYCQFVL